MKIILLFFNLLIIESLYGQLSTDTIGSRISKEDALEILNHHNLVRNEVGSPELIWSRELAIYAQDWADYLAKNNGCKMKHHEKPNINGKPVGENLFWGSSSTVYHPIDASKSWYSEKKMYTYGKFGKGNWHEIGHYTQMIWKNTKQVGVGIAICRDGAIMIVASYYPAGNYMEQYPY